MILFFIPSYNDHELVSSLAESLLIENPQSQLLVIDDGSSVPIRLDVEYALRQRVALYRLETNAGLGLATSIAIDHFLLSSCSVFVRLDSDGQHPVSEVSRLVEPVVRGDADLVWAQRQHSVSGPRAAGIDALRMGSKAATRWLAQRALGCSHSDWFSGFFALSREAALRYESDHLERYCEVQMLCLAFSRALRVRTIMVGQLDRLHGESTIKLFGGLMVVLRAWLLILVHATRKARP